MSEKQCILACYYETPGCLAVNVITTNAITTCEMTTGLSNESDMVDDLTSVVYVTSKYSVERGRYFWRIFFQDQNAFCIYSQIITNVWKSLATAIMEHANELGHPPDVIVLIVSKETGVTNAKRGSKVINVMNAPLITMATSVVSVHCGLILKSHFNINVND